MIEEIKLALEGLLTPDIVEEAIGTAEVRDIFKVPKLGMIAGCYIEKGKVIRNFFNTIQPGINFKILLYCKFFW